MMELQSPGPMANEPGRTIADEPSCVKSHYSPLDLIPNIQDALTRMGKLPGPISCRDLAPVDQLHTGGAKATLDLIPLTGLAPGAQVLDAGCGIGGSTRLLAEQSGFKVIGIDLSESFIEAATTLTQWCGLEEAISFFQGSILDLPFEPRSFDAILCQHILLNIEDKALALAEFYRVLAPGGRLILHEITRGEGPEPAMPVPWARDAAISFLLPWQELSDLCNAAGFKAIHSLDLTQESAAWWKKINQIKAKKQNPSPLHPGLVFGQNARFFGDNMEKNFKTRAIRCRQALFTKPA